MNPATAPRMRVITQPDAKTPIKQRGQQLQQQVKALQADIERRRQQLIEQRKQSNAH